MVQDELNSIKEEILNIRKTIKYLNILPLNLHNFKVIAKESEVSTLKRLVLYVPTLWNSIYLMLDMAIVYKDIFFRYSIEDPCFVWLLGHESWERMTTVIDFLHVFQNIYFLFYASMYPTTNLFLIEFWNKIYCWKNYKYWCIYDGNENKDERVVW